MKAIALALAAGALFAAQPQKAPTLREAQQFMDKVESTLLDLSTTAGRADWVYATYINGDSEALSAQHSERLIAATVAFAKQSTRFDKLALPPELARKMKLLKLSLTWRLRPTRRRAASWPKS
jgi:peptidyl-dipeptidase A